KSEVEFDRGDIRTDDPATAYQKVLAYVGASLSRDTVDKRAIHDTRTGTATVMDGGNGSTNGYIDTQEAVGGWPVLNSFPAPVDRDGDGMPDAWELTHGLDPNDPSDGNEDRDNDLYTNIEEYINSLALDFFDTEPLVNVVQPQNNEVFIAGADTSILVEAYSHDYNGGSVVKMELYLDDVLVAGNHESSKILTVLEDVSPGLHHIIVKSVDDSGRLAINKTAVFVGSKEVRLNIEDSPNGQVELMPSGGIYTEGIRIKATAIPLEGYHFEAWAGDIETTQNQLQIKTSEDIKIKPVFVKDVEEKSMYSGPIKINFQPEEDYKVPEGYMADFGGKYCDKWNGYTYGWMEGHHPLNGLNVNETGVWETFRNFENDGNQFSWGIELPRGRYRIRLGLGGTLPGT
ncbi:MAG: hypothetical protein KAT15_05025, partial [Bacteroidales bacterium]|nr:hypothetical protein [Bacteroidales bacterium]